MTAQTIERQNSGDQAYYVYAIARSRPGIDSLGQTRDKDFRLSIDDLDLPPHSNSNLTEGLNRPSSIINHQSYALVHRDVMAIVSPVPLAEFGPGALEANLQDPEWIRDRVLAHQQVVTALLGGYTLIPFKFCTLFSTEGRVQDMLSQHYETLNETLNRLEGALEWGVKITCDRRRLMEWVQARSENLQPLRAKIAQAAEGAAYFLGKQLEGAAEEETERVMATYVEESHQRLARSARETITRSVQPRHPPPAPPRPPLGNSPQPGRRGGTGGGGRRVRAVREPPVLNAAYLVDETRTEDFRAVLAMLEAGYADQGFGFELTGPWPPYNFTHLELRIAPPTEGPDR
jgi:hypothetical protein